ncbi:MAG: helix-turn-helix transcriptional regulator [Lachnospiraceae bacterium]|nr:helix-turn-helix transcriptional regulator [Lachnospiraceae bacterium]
MKRGVSVMMPKITLKAARVNAGMTQDDVAKVLHRTKQTIVNWETGVTDIRYNDLKTLSDLYKMPIEYINIPEKREKGSAKTGGSIS